MATPNEEYLDALIRHQTGLLRVASSIRKRANRLLDATESDVASNIRRRLASAEGFRHPGTVSSMRRLFRRLRAIRNAAWIQVRSLVREELEKVNDSEMFFLEGTLPEGIEATIPTFDEAIASIPTEYPVEGRTLSEWLRDLQRADRSRIEAAVRIGLVMGDSSPAVARRVVGTLRLKGRDGVSEVTRRQLGAVIRTAVVAFTNQAKREFYLANRDVFREELYVATLASRTTIICGALDGKRFPLGQGPIPTLHMNCRSFRYGILRGSPVPQRVSFAEWLRRQSREFQDDLLGVTRARLFRGNRIRLESFVTKAGDELTLEELARKEGINI